MTRTRRAVAVLVAAALAAGSYLLFEANPPICVSVSCSIPQKLTR